MPSEFLILVFICNLLLQRYEFIFCDTNIYTIYNNHIAFVKLRKSFFATPFRAPRQTHCHATSGKVLSYAFLLSALQKISIRTFHRRHSLSYHTQPLVRNVPDDIQKRRRYLTTPSPRVLSIRVKPLLRFSEIKLVAQRQLEYAVLAVCCVKCLRYTEIVTSVQYKVLVLV